MTAGAALAGAASTSGHPGLAGTIAALAAPRSDIEGAFVRMGEQLVGCIGLIQEMVAGYESMPAEFETAAFLDAVQQLQVMGAEVRETAARGTARTNDIVALAAAADAVRRPLDTLRRAVRGLLVAALNARIVAAGLGSSEDDFAGFAAEMLALVRSIEEAVAAFAESFRQFGTRLQVAQAFLADFAAQHEDTPARVGRRLDEQLGAIEAHRAWARDSVAAYSQRNAGIAQQISVSVSALQVGDITRQRLEHAEAALSGLAPFEATDGAVIDAVCHLQAAQVRAAGQQLDLELDQLGMALQSLAEEAGAVLGAGRRDAETLLSAGTSALAGIVGGVTQSRVLLQEFGKTRARLETLGLELAGAVEDMSAKLEAVMASEHEIRLLSLNAAIWCSRMGEAGLGLSVISENLRHVAAEAGAAARDIATSLAGTDEIARSLTAGSHAGKQEQVDRAAAKAIALLGDSSGRLDTGYRRMRASGEQILGRLRSAVESASELARLSEPIHDAAAEILSQASGPLPHVNALPAPAHQQLDEAWRRYTMDAERRIHESLLGRPVPAMDDAEAEDPGDDLEAVLF